VPAGTEMVMPGDNVSIKVSLIQPIAMDEGLRFAIREVAVPSARVSWENSKNKANYMQNQKIRIRLKAF